MNNIRVSILSYVPLLSMFILMLGSGLFGTLVSLRLKIDGEADLAIGIITSVFYLGMFIGSVQLTSILTKVGHIRSFAGFTAVFAVSILATGMKQDIYLWALARFFSGYSLAGLYIAVESWILGLSNKGNRGRFLALYMVALYGGSAAGQFFLNPAHMHDITPFCIAAILSILSIIPVTVMMSKAPAIKSSKHLPFLKLYKISPTGVIGCVISGIIIASVYGLMPAYFKGAGYEVKDISMLMFYAICGGVLLQYPLGYISDLIDKRLILLFLCLLGVGACSALIGCAFFAQTHFTLMLIITFIFGGIIFSIYPVCMSHLCDYITSKSIIEATKGLMIAYGIGSVSGPLIISYAMNLFVSFATVLLSFATLIAIRLVQSRKAIHATANNMKVTPESTYILPSKTKK